MRILGVGRIAAGIATALIAAVRAAPRTETIIPFDRTRASTAQPALRVASPGPSARPVPA